MQGVMEGIHRPPLGLDVYGAIELEQEQVDRAHWTLLREMFISPMDLLLAYTGSAPFAGKRPAGLAHDSRFNALRETLKPKFQADWSRGPT